MFLTELDAEEVRKEVSKYLKSLGVLKQKLKKIESKQVVEKEYGVFKIRLEKIKQKKCKLEQFDSLVGVPGFVEETCTYLRQQINTEGLFRKPALAVRQKELKEYMTSGGHLAGDSSFNVTEVANLLKQFFRELPEPCIPYTYHDALLKCLDLKGQQKDSIMLVILLLPLEYLVTLAYLMQFLREVALHSHKNLMDVNNLAIVWTPNLMPVKPGQVSDKKILDKHMTIIRILIENASSIGIVPEYLYEHLTNWQPSTSLSSHDELELSRNKEKKKKRRSGSLTRMLKRMVGRSISPDPVPELDVTPDQTVPPVAHTPRILSTAKKRKASESNLPTFSAKKRRDLLDSLPQKTLLPDICTTTYLTPRVLVAQPNCQNKDADQKRKSKFYTSKTPDGTERRKSRRSLSGTKLRLSHFGLGRKHKKKSMVMDDSGLERTSSLDNLDLTTSSEDYVRISRSEYEDIKNRVSQIESRISSEFENIVGVSMSDLELTPEEPRRSIRTVQTAYERTLESAEKFNSPTSDELAKKLNRELRIRSSEKKVIRSPSARKIGTIRRRSRENAPVIKRNLSLNIPERIINQVQFYPGGLRRGKPNTVQNGLPDPVMMPQTNFKMNYNGFANNLNSESFETQGCESNVFDLNSFGVLTRSQARRATSFHGCDLSKVPSSTLANVKTPNKPPLQASRLSEEINWKTAEDFLKEEKTDNKSVTGRPSVAKIRSQNAGMVLAKAKLFSTMVDSEQKTRVRAFKTGEVDDGKSKEIKKRNSSKSSKDRKPKEVRNGGNNISRQNSLRKQALESMASSKRQLSKLCNEKENLPNSKIVVAQSSSSRTPQRASRTVQNRAEDPRNPGKTNTVNSPLRERPRFNNVYSSNLRTTNMYGRSPMTPHHIKTGNTASPRPNKTNVTPRRSPRQQLLKSKQYAVKP